MTNGIEPDMTLATIVNECPELARELERWSLDYCCGGQQTLAEACAGSDLDTRDVIKALTDFEATESADWVGLGPVELVEHIQQTHHHYLARELPRIDALVGKVASVHGENHPELGEVQRVFSELRSDLEPHMDKEDRGLFAMIGGRLSSGTDRGQIEGAFDEVVEMLVPEHEEVGALLTRLRELTNGYAVPDDACASFTALYRGLAQLEADTHLHVHKENSVLFPMLISRG